jgi:DNA-binding NarL/FixJ family response regulator
VVIALLMGRGRRNDPLSELTPREREVLALMAEGLSNTAIAKRLWLTVGAVEKHISSIFARLGLLPGDDENRRVRAVLTYLEASR